MENVGLFGGLIYMAIIVLMIVSMWKIFEKAGKPGWAALIPIYNTIVMIEIVGKPVWWILLLIIPGVNIVFGIWLLNLLAKSFGKDVGFTLGLIFLGLIFYPILGLGDAKYQGPAGQ
ncbi:DUF5684 domain-containing protein [Carboxylicivirga sp. RSCT41]|uniref:DUF5684 domain-containing protein n=1 Tax=Carboxylicivirga agarovorans TaxID=3417570 RepID=UPI003D3500A5